MLRGYVYGVLDDRAGSVAEEWRVTICPSVDVEFWRGRELIWVAGDRAWSFGQACVWRDGLEQYGGDVGRVFSWIKRRGLPAGEGIPRFRRSKDAGEAERVPGDSAFRIRVLERLRGRSLLMEELESLWGEAGGAGSFLSEGLGFVQREALRGTVQLVPGFMEGRGVDRCCRRCGSGAPDHRRSFCPQCGGECSYCEACLQLGRVRACSLLVESKDGGVWPARRPPGSLDRWGLSPAQREATRCGVEFLLREGVGERGTVGDRAWVGERRRIQKQEQEQGQGQGKGQGKGQEQEQEQEQEQGRKWSWERIWWFGRDRHLERRREFLIWAVTGAGKTEMVYPLIEHMLQRGGRVLFAAPRRDVILELKPRLAKAFPDVDMAAYYGGSDGEKWGAAELVLATTHQLLRFSCGFDLAIIDELDAFPYHGNPMLQRAVQRAIKPDGRIIWLSATPPASMLQELRRGKLEHVKVPVRYHRHPLPVPLLQRSRAVADWIAREELPWVIVGYMAVSMRRGAQLFVFVPYIKQVEPLTALIRRAFPELSVEGTASVDAERGEKVLAFRGRQHRILVTTTILERGVTVAKSDVLVTDAGSSQFGEAALVQMAGRAGRSADDPHGTVLFVSPTRTRSQTGAVAQIRLMNKLAAKEDFLRAKEEEERR